MAVSIIPPIYPSRVFDGMLFLLRGVLPISTPTKEAKAVLTGTQRSGNITQ
jgi:hypothetical protein